MAGEKEYKDRMLVVRFMTVFEYLTLLEEICRKLAVLRKEAIVYLSAAVSDYYIPQSELAVHKIQSGEHPTLELSLKPVPKLL